ncbi:MAG: hypothetical protein BMS9Abin22_189 [Gammaproteobacteria bacterium]|nr:MAG: hypothetical protein BMS9Abin22_189 [Gammaproteobacteria bacterium]
MPDAKKITIAVLLTLLAGGTWWLSQKATTPEAPFDGKTRHDPDYTIENFTTFVMNERGRRKYVLKAKRLAHYPDDGTSDLEQPYLIQYREGGAPLHTRATTGQLSNDASQIIMRGNVRVSRGRDPGSPGGEIKAERMKILLNK